MNKTLSEPPGARKKVKIASLAQAEYQSQVIHFPQTQPILTEQPFPVAPVYQSVEAVVRELRPEMPVYCLRPAHIMATARRFVKAFPGDVMYAVKCNPEPRVLSWLFQAGVTHYDVASLAEVKLVAETLPAAQMHFMHPVKPRSAVAAAYMQYGVRDFSLDSLDELDKILDATGYADDLGLFVRIAIHNESAAYSLAGKYGVPVPLAAELLAKARPHAKRLGVCFHVGSQCMEPEAYERAIDTAMQIVAQAGVKLDVLDIGGGFPSVYPGLTPPPLGQYMRAIKKALKAHVPSGVQIISEPGRALVAEGGSTVARIDARRGNMLYLNEGVYGSLFDAGVPGFVYPVKAIRPDDAASLSQQVAEFGFFGPTCDSMDTMKGPFHLPENIGEGDWIEIGQLGSYGITMRTNFNGFYSDAMVNVADKPLLSMRGVN